MRTLETIQFGISGSAGPEGRYCNTENRKCTMSQMEQTPEPLLSHQNKLYNTTNSRTHLRLGSAHTAEESGAPPQGRNQGAAPSHPKTLCPTALPLKVLTLLFKLLTFRPQLKFALTPAQVHNAPGLGPDRMPQIPGAWVYLWSKACQRSSSCCVRLLVMSL